MPDSNNRELPSDLTQVGSVLKYDLYRHLRSRRLISVLLIEVLVLALILLIPPALGNTYPVDPASFVSQFTSFVTIIAIIGATMFAGDSLVSEFQNRTGYLIFPNPVKRWVFFTGKLLASLTVITAVIIFYYAVAIITGLISTGGVSILVFASLGLALLFAAACTGISYLLSAIMKTTTGSLVFTFFLLFLILPIVDGVGSFAGARTDFSLTFQQNTINYILNTPYPQDSVTIMPGGMGPGGGNMTLYTFIPQVDTAIVVMAAYLVVTAVIALVFFKRREMTG
jgi:ABC-2 type transport system permease protein